MRDTQPIVQPLAGSLLLASPELIDPNFFQSVVLMSVHDDEQGALGVIINRPTGKTLAEVDARFSLGTLAEVPVYEGGPVSSDQVILSAWQCDKQAGVFKLFFGLSEEKALELKAEEPEMEIRGFLGYAGWSNGQLERELEENAWVVSAVNTKLVGTLDGVALWRKILRELSPDLKGLPEAPDDLSRN